METEMANAQLEAIRVALNATVNRAGAGIQNEFDAMDEYLIFGQMSGGC